MKFYFIVIFTILTIYNAQSDPYTDYILKASARLNGNIYSSDFSKIGVHKNCCPKYESAYGLAPAVYLGGEIRNAFNLFGYSLNYSMLIGYNDMSAGYTINQYIGNDLGTDDYDKIIVEHKLDLTYSVLSNEHALWFTPMNGLPLDIKFGLNLGIPLSKEFYQREVLLEPSDATFSDGTTEFNPAKAELPNATGLLLGLSLGARYKITTFSDFDLFGDINFNYGLNGITSDLDWNIHQAALGLTLNYNIPKSEPPRPPAPPEPPAPDPVPPPIARKPEMKIETEFDYKKVNSGDTLKVTINKYEYVTYASVLPILIFEKNSTKIIPGNSLGSQLGNLYAGTFSAYDKLNISERYPELIADHLKNNPGSKVKIIAESEDEDNAVMNSRIKLVKDALIARGVDSQSITSETKTVKSKRDNNPAITEESRKIFFDFSKSSGLIEAKVSTDYLVDNFNKVMNIRPVFFAEDTLKFSGITTFNNGNESELKIGANQVVFSSSMFVSNDGKPNKFNISAEVSDSDGNSASAKSGFYLTHTEKLVKSYINLNKDDRSSEVEEFILGFTRFDDSEFYLVNTFAVDYIRGKISEGKNIEVIPLTDNIGTPEYNENLAKKRADAAINLIGKQFDRYEVKLQKQELFNNSSPYGRMMNRAVIIRIK